MQRLHRAGSTCISAYTRKSPAGGAPMQLSRVDLNLFTIFDAIYRDGGITPASKRLHLSQPAVSHALARLRELLDDPLFERRGHDMVPTPLARSIAANVATSLGGLEQLLQRTGRFDPGTSQRSFTIAMREFNELPFLPLLDRTRAARSAARRHLGRAHRAPRPGRRPAERRDRSRLRRRPAAIARRPSRARDGGAARGAGAQRSSVDSGRADDWRSIWRWSTC